MSKSEQTRQFIIEKTAPVFNVKGYVGTSLSDMTDATQLTKGSIYGNFGNKDEVALAAFDHNLDKAVAVITREMEKCHSAREKLLVYGKVYAGLSVYPLPVGGCPILNTATESDDTHPGLKQKVAAAVDAWRKKIKGIIEEGKVSKEFSSDTDAQQAAFTLIAIIEGGHMISKVTGKPSDRKAILDSLQHFVDQL